MPRCGGVGPATPLLESFGKMSKHKTWGSVLGPFAVSINQQIPLEQRPWRSTGFGESNFRRINLVGVARPLYFSRMRLAEQYRWWMHE